MTALDPDGPEQAEALTLLASWDLHTDKESRQAALGVCILLEEWSIERSQEPLPPARETLIKCMASVTALSGRLDPKWGEIQRHGRDGRTWAASGGPDTLRAMYAEQLSDDDDYLTVVAGDGLYYLIEWRADGEQIIRGTHQYGSQMTDPSSKHYLDQAEAFAQEILRAPGFAAANRASPTRRYTVSSLVSD